ncbi:hypothetical protein KEM56_000560 [Ascosphaera pollenicola]|nr:hypothetical protein KEM56_000560 [Ascosphaera pollenicola]
MVMVMVMAQNWCLLPKSATQNGVPLLFRFTASSAGYELLLTDLTCLWSEKLDSKQVIRRATNDNTSIDPGEDREQFEVFLSKIRDAFAGREGSRLALASDGKSSRLMLETETQLPDPFEPLAWSFSLEELPSSAITEYVVLPLVNAERVHEAQVSSLKGLLEEKDWAIEKLLDKLETANIDLNTIFPGQRFSRKAPTSNGRGMTAFNEKRWVERFASEASSNATGESILQALSDFASLEDVYPAHQKWWRGLKVDSRKRDDTLDTKSSTKQKIKDSNKRETQKDDSDFEVMSPGPDKKSDRKTKTTRSPEEDETESGSEASSSDERQWLASKKLGKRTKPPSSTDSSASESEAKRPSESISKIGGPKSRTRKDHKPATGSRISRDSDTGAEQTASEEKPSPARRPEHTPEDEVTESETDDSTSRKKATKSRKGGLGKVGGMKNAHKAGKKAESTPKPGEESTESESDTMHVKDTHKNAGLGKLGGKRADQKDSTKPKRTPKLDEESTDSDSDGKRKKAIATKKSGLGKLGGKKKPSKPLKRAASDEIETASESGKEGDEDLSRHRKTSRNHNAIPGQERTDETKRLEISRKREASPMKDEDEGQGKELEERKREEFPQEKGPPKPMRAPVLPKKKRRF